MITSKSSTLELTDRSASAEDQHRLFRRKGGGGRGGGGKGGKGGSRGKGGSSAKVSSAAKKHGASDAFLKSRGGQTFSLSNTKSPAYAYADGGGKRVALSSTSPFNGREAGGGSRETVYGSSRFGSGYPYGSYGAYVDNRPFPYYYYPVSPSYNYYGSREYDDHNSDRPGGPLVTAIVQPSFNTSSVTYRLLGDNTSVTAVFDALVANCSVANSSFAISAFTQSNTSWPLPEQVVQYYRASSFALSLDGYNNTASLFSNAPISNASAPLNIQDTPLPSGLNTTFLECVNSTTGASVPLVDTSKKKLSGGQIAQIVCLSIMGFAMVWACVYYCCIQDWRRSWRIKRKERAEKKMRKKEMARLSRPPDILVSNIGGDKSMGFSDSKTARPTSADERTLAAESSSGKDRWSYASSSDSHTIKGYDYSSKTEEGPSHATQESIDKKPTWLTKIPIVGQRFGYRSVKHQSTSSVEIPLTDPHHQRSPSAEHSNSPSRNLSPCPSPSPHSPSSPLMSGSSDLLGALKDKVSYSKD